MIKKFKKAFTITELVIVIAVIAILAAVLIPTFSTVISKANESAAMQECRNEWTEKSVDIIGNETVGDDYLFEYKNGKDTYYYIVVDGNFNATKLTTAPSIPGTLTHEKRTFNVPAKGEASTNNEYITYYALEETTATTVGE